jgi:hypothetical protein
MAKVLTVRGTVGQVLPNSRLVARLYPKGGLKSNPLQEKDLDSPPKNWEIQFDPVPEHEHYVVVAFYLDDTLTKLGQDSQGHHVK